MAHFAELDDNNIVLRVIVISNDEIKDENGQENEALGIALCQKICGGGRWKQTSYNNNFRNKYAGEGEYYDESLDVFTAPQPYPSWTLSSENYAWLPPTPKPQDDNQYEWDEESLSWVLIVE